MGFVVSAQPVQLIISFILILSYKLDLSVPRTAQYCTAATAIIMSGLQATTAHKAPKAHVQHGKY